MALIVTGNGITNIQGGFGGVYFHRDKSGLHCAAKPRRVDQGTPKQQKQRAAFLKARAACLAAAPTVIPENQLNRWVSYYMYRALNNLPFLFDITASGTPVPNCTGIYILGGQIFGQNWYKRIDNAWVIWCKAPPKVWYISTELGVHVVNYWYTTNGFFSCYNPYGGATGIVRISSELRPPPADYQIPKL